MNSNNTFDHLRSPNKRDIILCTLLLMSFCYELPLVEITAYDRFNPRLFDISLLVAALFTGWKRNKKLKIVRIWEILTGIFVFSAIISFIALLPIQYGYFSLFFAGKYIETLLALWIMTGLAWKKEHIENLLKFFCIGMIFAGIWGLLQLLGILNSERYLPNGTKIVTQSGIILATFGPTYFHSGVMGAIGTGISLSLFMNGSISKKIFAPAFLASLFLATFSGSRAALALAVFIVLVLIVKNIKYIAISTSFLFTLLLIPGVTQFMQDNSVTIQRIEDTGSHNSIERRASANYFEVMANTISVHGPSLVAVGGGFYAVPMPDRQGNMKYRVGYGLHNIHFFTFEQAGLAAFLVALYFWYIVIRTGYKNKSHPLGRCGLGISAGIALFGWTGQIFYHGFGTENMISAQLILLALLLYYSPNESAGEATAAPEKEKKKSFTYPQLKN